MSPNNDVTRRYRPGLTGPMSFAPGNIWTDIRNGIYSLAFSFFVGAAAIPVAIAVAGAVAKELDK